MWNGSVPSMAEKPAQAVVGWEQMGSVPPFTSHDPATEGWARRRNDPRVVERMAHLRERSGIAGLEVVAPDDVEAAARLFLRDGFVVVRDVMSAAQLSRVQVASTKLVATNPMFTIATAVMKRAIPRAAAVAVAKVA